MGTILMYNLKEMTDEEVVKTMITVVNRIAPKYTFYGYGPDDMKQEAFIICMESMDKYDESRPLENFLSFILPGRLINVIRNKHFLKNSKDDKKRVAMPGQLSNEESTHYYETFMLDDLDVYELFNIVDGKIPYEHRENYLKVLSGVHIDKKLREQINDIIRDIAIEAGYDPYDD